jgi:hypothetical protein
MRLVMAWLVGVWGVRDKTVRQKLWLIPLRDAVNFVVWLAGMFGNRVRWGGVEYRVNHGRMARPAERSHAPGKITAPAAR